VFHISIWRDLELHLGAKPTKDPRCDETETSTVFIRL